jgi:hypothetical protein
MIIGIEGGIGQGKTLVMTYFAKEEALRMKKRLHANYHLKDLPFRYLDFQTFIDEALTHHQYRDSCILVDEAHVWIDSRTSMKKQNLLFTYLLLQTGKEDVNMYYTTQDFGQVDKRLRQRTDIAIHVRRKGDHHLLTIEDRTSFKRKRALVYGPDVWPFFDTRETVKIPMFENRTKATEN